jgi:transcriptional regulator GlxA family with amidase domain
MSDAAMTLRKPDRSVVFVVFEGLQGLDLMGPLEVFADANDELQGGPGPHDGPYRLTVAAVRAGLVRTSSGVGISAEVALADIEAPIDTLVVVGGDGTYGAFGDQELVGEIRRLAADARRVTSVCSGAFLLAAAGLLDGRRATTHWRACELLAATFPAVTVEPDPIIVRDGNVATSAGVTAGMDLALALVEDDLGRDIALRIARRLVLFLRRPANQSQFSAPLAGQLAARDEIRDVQQHVVEHPASDCSVAALARHAAMSERNFTRSFTIEVGITPARYVERVRVETARRLLEDTDEGVDAVAAASGFGTAETMRRTFLRHLRTNPTEYRRRFSAA